MENLASRPPSRRDLLASAVRIDASAIHAARREGYRKNYWPELDQFMEEAETVEDHAKVWDEASEEFERVYAEFFKPHPGFLKSGLDAALKIEMPPADRGLRPAPISPTSKTLKTQLVEDNLEKAAVALARAAALKAEYDDQAARAASLALDVKEFVEGDRAWRAQVAAGSLSLPVFEAAQAWEMAKANQRDSKAVHDRAAETLAKYYGDSNLKDFPLALAGMIRSAFAASLPRNKSEPYDAKESFNYDSSRPYVNDLRELPQKEHAMAAARLQGEHTFGVERIALTFEQTRGTIGMEAADHAVAAAGERVEWATRQAQLEKQQHEAAVEITKLKMAAACAREGSLNFAEQAKQARTLFESEVIEAMARLGAAAVGLHAVFGYERPLPQSLSSRLPREIASRLASAAPDLYNPANEEPDGTDTLDLVGLARRWVGQAVYWLGATRHRERRFVLAMPLRPLLGAGWATVASPEGATFALGRNDLGLRGSIRLLAVGLEAKGAPADAGSWRVEMEVPSTGDYGRFGEPARPGVIEQSHAPRIMLGRVEQRSDARSVPLEASDVVANSSPLGQWRIWGLGASTGGTRLDAAQDLILHLALAEIA